VDVIINSLIRAAELSLLAVGLTMIYDVLRFPSFAQVSFGSIGAYLTFAFASQAGLGMVAGVILAVLIVAVLGVITDYVIFSKLRNRAPILLMIASFGLAILIRSLLQAGWGAQAHSFPIPLLEPWNIFGGLINAVDVGIILASVVSMIGFYLLLSHTKLGISMRATADNPQLSEARGIVTERVIKSVWFISTGFAAIGGIMFAMESQLSPGMGKNINLEMFSAAILGGIGNPYGAVAGALAIGFADNIALAINWAPLFHALGMAAGEASVYIPTGYKPAPAFVILIVILIFRPQGIFGGKSP
jgi:branched-subunit amino acid ABC-type transport system permease component